MDQFDEIPNIIKVFEGDRQTNTIVIDQMAKSYNEFLTRIQEKSLQFTNIKFLDAEEEWADLRNEDDYNKAVRGISSQSFHLRAYFSHIPAVVYDRRDQFPNPRNTQIISSGTTSLKTHSERNSVGSKGNMPPFNPAPHFNPQAKNVEKTNREWRCRVCDARNVAKNSNCDICGNPR